VRSIVEEGYDLYGAILRAMLEPRIVLVREFDLLVYREV